MLSKVSQKKKWDRYTTRLYSLNTDIQSQGTQGKQGPRDQSVIRNSPQKYLVGEW